MLDKRDEDNNLLPLAPVVERGVSTFTLEWCTEEDENEPPVSRRRVEELS